MHTFKLLTLFLLLFSYTLKASTYDLNKVMAGANVIKEATLSLNHKAVMELTPQKAISRMGGEEKAYQTLKNVEKYMVDNDIKILSMEVFEPVKVVTTDLNTIIFLPTEMGLQMQSRKGISKGYLMAIKEVEKDTWKYLDTSSIKNRRDMEFYFPLYPKHEIVPEIVLTFE